MSRSLVCAALLILAGPLWAQSNPTTAPDLSSLIERLSTRAGRDAALEQLKKLSVSALVPLSEAQIDETQPKALRDDLALAIDGIATRDRAAITATENRSFLAWNSDTGVKVYEKSSADPKWDALVHKGFSDFDQNQFSKALDSFSAAVKAGCADPLVRFDRDYCAVLTSHSDRAAAFAELCKALQAFEDSAYPNSRKCALEASFVVLADETESRRLIPESLAFSTLRKGKAHFKDLVSDHPGRSALRHNALNLYIADGALGGRRKESSKDCIDAFSAALSSDSLSCFLKANYYTEWAWEARGNGFANTVTEAGATLFQERLAQARAVAEQGWRINPLDPDCPAVMITICMGAGLGHREMETWFSRAMLADPHNYEACCAKALYLEPKWGGSEKDALDFGRFCVAHGDAQDRLPTILIQVYRDLVELTPGANPFLSTPQYWPDLQSAYSKLLADKSRLQSHRGQYLSDRGAYVKAACDTQHWKEANALMKEFGKDIDVSAMGGQALYDYFQRKAAAAAQGNAP